MIPDLMDAITAVRAWAIDDTGLLTSVNSSQKWTPYEASAAICTVGPEQQAHWHPDTGETTPAPAPGCTCGFYAYKSVIGPDHRALGVQGEVKLWGRIIEHDTGYRAQFAYPSRLRCLSPRLAARLRYLYGVPCEVDESLPPAITMAALWQNAVAQAAQNQYNYMPAPTVQISQPNQLQSLLALQNGAVGALGAVGGPGGGYPGQIVRPQIVWPRKALAMPSWRRRRS